MGIVAKGLFHMEKKTAHSYRSSYIQVWTEGFSKALQKTFSNLKTYAGLQEQELTYKKKYV